MRSRFSSVQIYLIIGFVASVGFSMMGFVSGIYRVEVAQLDPFQLVLLGTALEGAVFLFEVPVKGSFLALVIGAVLYVTSTTALGLLISTFMKTQIAAIFGTTIITVIPTLEFSGFFGPTSALSGTAWLMGQAFPSTYFQQISLGTFTKGLEFSHLYSKCALFLLQIQQLFSSFVINIWN